MIFYEMLMKRQQITKNYCVSNYINYKNQIYTYGMANKNWKLTNLQPK